MLLDNVTFNPEVTLGAILTVLSMLFIAAGFYFQTSYDSRRFKSDIQDIKTDLKILNKLVTDIALQNQRLDAQAERLNRLDSRIDELRHGKGFIKE